MGTKSCRNRRKNILMRFLNIFYDDLPRDEKVLVDCLQAIDAVRATSNSLYGESVLEKWSAGLTIQRCI